MRILQIPNAPAPGNSLPTSVTPSPERVESLEHIAKSILEKLESIEERIKALEKTRHAADPPSVPRPVPSAPAPQTSNAAEPLTSVAIDADAVNKGLLAKMWKYLNDEQSEKAV
jgi:hypothetical protein